MPAEIPGQELQYQTAKIYYWMTISVCICCMLRMSTTVLNEYGVDGMVWNKKLSANPQQRQWHVTESTIYTLYAVLCSDCS